MRAQRSKTVATWLAIVGGVLGLHRFYLHGFRDLVGWLFPVPTLIGWLGVQRMQSLGQDDQLSWLLIPVLGLAVSAAMLSAILIALTPNEQWLRRHGGAAASPSAEPPASNSWGPVLGAIVALLIGGGALMGTIAFGGQKYFEWQQEKEQQAATPPTPR